MSSRVPLIRFKQVTPNGPTVVVLAGEGPAIATADGGWQVVQRPKWVGFTDWAGFDPYRMAVPILFDEWRRGKSVEGNIELLRRMMRPASTPRTQTPVVKVSGPTIPHQSFKWVITSIEPGEEIRRPSDGRRVRAFFTVHLLQYLPADILVTANKSPAKAAEDAKEGSGAATTTKTYTVKKGDTLSGIAKWHLGDASKWHAIADLNGIRDPRTLQIGQVLRIP